MTEADFYLLTTPLSRNYSRLWYSHVSSDVVIDPSGVGDVLTTHAGVAMRLYS